MRIGNGACRLPLRCGKHLIVDFRQRPMRDRTPTKQHTARRTPRPTVHLAPRLLLAAALVAAIALAITPWLAFAKSPAGVMWQERRVSIGGITRVYQVYRPANARDGAAAVMVLHGGSQSMHKIFSDKGGANLAWIDIADREGAVLIAPNGTHRRTARGTGDRQNWNDYRADTQRAKVDDVAFLRRVVEDETRAQRLDPKRIFVTGGSNGGMMTFRMLIDAPELFAGGAAFIANMPVGADNLPRPARPTPLMIVNGTADPLVKWSGGVVANDDERGATISTSETVAWWVRANNATLRTTQATALPDRDPRDGCTITLDAHNARPNGAPVWLYTANGGGHAMPSIRYDLPDSRLVRRMIGTACRDVEGAELAWQFFMAQFAPR
jgi:polyhydroxybutyrate depolymerase